MTAEYLIDAKSGDRRSLARILSAIENRSLRLDEALDVLGPVPPLPDDDWQTLAITGAPGVGKSCLLDGLLTSWAKQGLRVAVLAVDPSSPRTGGALLGDRVRMTVVDDNELNQQIYFRSVATRKASGSVPVIVEDMTKVLLSLGWEKVVIETVGAGQATVLLQLPSSGRSVRARWRERLLAFHERKILESPKLDDLLHQLAKGSIHLDEAMRLIGGFADE